MVSATMIGKQYRLSPTVCWSIVAVDQRNKINATPSDNDTITPLTTRFAAEAIRYAVAGCAVQMNLKREIVVELFLSDSKYIALLCYCNTYREQESRSNLCCIRLTNTNSKFTIFLSIKLKALPSIYTHTVNISVNK